MPHVRITLSREMLQVLMANLAELRSPACEYVVENEIEGVNEITRIINLISGDVFEQVVQKQDTGQEIKQECKIYEFPSRSGEGNETP
ncbi:MAG: hypothetical protein WAO24_03425 [Peptococcia bacterium]